MSEAVQLSDAEWKVMTCVWQRTPATARDVRDELEADTGWAYTTVKTLMSRLVEKKALKVRMRGNTSVYEARITRKNARRSAVRDLMEKAFDGAFGPMMHFLLENKRLGARDRAMLQRLLAEKKK